MTYFKLKTGSIIDFKHEELAPEIWNEESKLKEEVQDFLYNQTQDFFERRNFKKYQQFIKGCFIASSLGTYYYTSYTDLDIKFVIDCDSLRKNNAHLSLPTENKELLDYLIKLGRGSSELTEFIPDTKHVIDCYFYGNAEDILDYLLKYDSLYSVGRNDWIKPPKKLPKDVSPDYILQKAKSFAAPYVERITQNIEKLRTDSIDFLILKDFIKNIDRESAEEFKFYVEDQIRTIDADLDTLIEDKALLKNLRTNNYNQTSLNSELERLGGSLNYGVGNLVFKVMQRYGYLDILSEVKKHFENNSFTEKDLPVLINLFSK